MLNCSVLNGSQRVVLAFEYFPMGHFAQTIFSDVDSVLSGHVMQSEAPVCGWYCVGIAQSVHFVLPRKLYFPAGQSWHGSESAEVLENVPALHREQFEDPGIVLYVPGLHCTHVLPPATLYVPESQGVHSDCDSDPSMKVVFPASQSEQFTKPKASLYFPTGQFEQWFLYNCMEKYPNVPGGHCRHCTSRSPSGFNTCKGYVPKSQLVLVVVLQKQKSRK